MESLGKVAQVAQNSLKVPSVSRAIQEYVVF